MGKHKLVFSESRSREWESKNYVIRDVFWSRGLDFLHCEYQTIENGKLVWNRCVEGVDYKDIEPLVMDNK